MQWDSGLILSECNLNYILKTSNIKATPSEEFGLFKPCFKLCENQIVLQLVYRRKEAREKFSMYMKQNKKFEA